MKTVSSAGGTSNTMGDIDASASLAQVSNVYKDPTPASKELIAGMDIDQGHGGINQIVQAKDGAASSTTMSVYNCSAPTPKDMGIS